MHFNFLFLMNRNSLSTNHLIKLINASIIASILSCLSSTILAFFFVQYFLKTLFILEIKVCNKEKFSLHKPHMFTLIIKFTALVFHIIY
jgi:hypothetical protein